MTSFSGHPLVVAVVPGQDPLVALTAADLARATAASMLVCAYVDPARFADEELPDGSVHHRPIDPDSADESWRDTEQQLVAQLDDCLRGQGVPWALRYLAGRADRALTHCARAVDAAAFVVGTQVRRRHAMAGFFEQSVSVRLAHHQHRPVLVVPLAVVDWDGHTPWQ